MENIVEFFRCKKINKLVNKYCWGNRK